MTAADPAGAGDGPRTLDLPRPTGTAGLAATTLGIARRTVLHNVRNPQVFVLGMVQGAMFLLIFRYVFGGAITTNGVRYVDFLVPGFVGTGVLFSGMTASIGAAEDFKDGLFDRLRSLPVPRIGIVAGRVVADTVLAGIGLTVTTLVGFARAWACSCSRSPSCRAPLCRWNPCPDGCRPLPTTSPSPRS